MIVQLLLILSFIVPVTARDSRCTYRGTGVCVAWSQDKTKSFIVTAKHNIEDAPHDVRVEVGGESVRAEDIRFHPTEDVATLWVPRHIPDRAFLASPSTLVDQTPVIFTGLRTGKPLDGTLMDTEWIRGQNNVHPQQGDSGGPVLIQYANGQQAVAGIVTGYDSENYNTKYVHTRRIVSFVKTQYGSCPTCPEYVRPIVRQPMVGIGFPSGPPEILIPKGGQGPAGPQGPPGPTGPQGEQGPPPDPRLVEQLVINWLEQNKVQLGPDPDIERRLTELENRNLRVMIVDGKTKEVIDDETYKPGEPVIFDLRRFNVRDNK